jgi:hypothetical protein
MTAHLAYVHSLDHSQAPPEATHPCTQHYIHSPTLPQPDEIVSPTTSITPGKDRGGVGDEENAGTENMSLL